MLAILSVGPNLALSWLAIVVFVVGVSLLWRPGEMPILLFIFVYQWAQGSSKIFHANLMGLEVDALAEFFAAVSFAIMMTLIALLALALGMRIGAGPVRAIDALQARFSAQQLSVRQWFRLYIIAWIASGVALTFAWIVPGLTQILLAFVVIKWAFYWMLCYASLLDTAESRLYAIFAFGLEFGLSIGGYFAEFKSVIFFTAFAVIAARTRLSIKAWISTAALSAAVLMLGVVWTAIKPGYRQFLSDGRGDQWPDRLAYIWDNITQLDLDSLASASNKMFQRISYVDMFAVVTENVPRRLPHEGGAIWWDAISRPLMPRLLFPDKAIIDDSARTNFYTGLDVAGMENSTSISIGYIAESYIDFGEIGMIIAIFFYGIALGRLHQWLSQSRSTSRIVGMGLSGAVLMPAAIFESSATKLCGAIAVAAIVAWLLIRYAPASALPRTNGEGTRP